MQAFAGQGAAQRGIVFMLAASFFFTLMDAAAKGLVETYPAPMVIWARFAGMSVLVLLILRRDALVHLRTRHPVFHLLRSAFQFGATGLFFASLSHIGLAEATAITDVAPVLITLGAALFLNERLGLRRIAGVAVALVGAMIVIRPGLSVFQPAAVLPLGAAVCYAGNVLLTRHLGTRESPWTAMILASAFGTVVGALWLPFVWVPVAAADLGWFALVGALGTAAQMCIIRAFSLAEASAIAPFAYVTILYATAWGILFFGEWPDGWTILGGAVIAGAGLYVWSRERRAAG